MVEVARGVGPEAAEPPEAPSGFNYTKHNCNNRRGRRKPPYCGTYTLIGAKEGQYTHRRFRCKGYSCPYCGRRKIRQVRRAIVHRAVENGLHRFLTLTLDPKKLPPDLDVTGKIRYLSDVWRKMRVYLKRKLGKSLVFIAVVELQKNGNPHLHMLVGSYLPKEWISDAWERLGGGSFTRIEYADMHRVAAYLAKYVTDESLQDLPRGTRRFYTSRGLSLFERSKSNGVWVLLKVPIEYWHERAAGITVEQYETEQDGARQLAWFVASLVPPPLAARLSANTGCKMWAEI